MCSTSLGTGRERTAAWRAREGGRAGWVFNPTLLPEGQSAFCLSDAWLINYDKYRIALLVNAHAPKTLVVPHPWLPFFSVNFQVYAEWNHGIGI